MKLFDILRLVMPSLKPEGCKIHLASWNKRDEPLALFRAGDFAAWQKWQGHKNFGRQYIVSLIKLDNSSRWLFAGVHVTHGCRSVACQEDQPWNKRTEYRPTSKSKTVKHVFHYDTDELPQFGELRGRLRSALEEIAKFEQRVSFLRIVSLVSYIFVLNIVR